MYTMKCKLIKPLVSTHDFSYPLSHWNRFRKLGEISLHSHTTKVL